MHYFYICSLLSPPTPQLVAGITASFPTGPRSPPCGALTRDTTNTNSGEPTGAYVIVHSRPGSAAGPAARGCHLGCCLVEPRRPAAICAPENSPIKIIAQRVSVLLQ